jgi:hypothetical protein
MAHFAEIDGDNIVTRVLVVPDAQENRGQEYLADDLGLGGTWVQTSYNANIRKNYAGIGYTFDSVRDAFIPPKPYASWVLNETTCNWDAPVARPEDDKMYTWDEATTSWKEVTE